MQRSESVCIGLGLKGVVECVRVGKPRLCPQSTTESVGIQAKPGCCRCDSTRTHCSHITSNHVKKPRWESESKSSNQYTAFWDAGPKALCRLVWLTVPLSRGNQQGLWDPPLKGKLSIDLALAQRQALLGVWHSRSWQIIPDQCRGSQQLEVRLHRCCLLPAWLFRGNSQWLMTGLVWLRQPCPLKAASCPLKAAICS